MKGVRYVLGHSDCLYDASHMGKWMSDDTIRLSQRGIGEPFLAGLLAGISGSIGFIVKGIETPSEIALCASTGIAVLVVVVKSIRGTLITKKEAEED